MKMSQEPSYNKEELPEREFEQSMERAEWIDSLDYVIETGDHERVIQLLKALKTRAYSKGIRLPFTAHTPYVNSIPASEQPIFPGSREIERRIKSIIRWNAMAMVVRANRKEKGIGGHISTYASAATLYEIGFNHFFRGPEHSCCGDQVYFQGHAAPGIYARSFVEGRLSVEQLKNFRHEAHPGGGLPSYPHPRLMPDYWQFATVSMGLGPIMAIYQARFNRYLEDRGLKESGNDKVWYFMGDGESDEPESLGAISLAARERLDNLIFVINCNLQRLDGPVRGNGNIVQELETIFRGAGWFVIKVLWGSDWDELLARDTSGLLVKRMGELVDGERQNYITRGGAYIREHFFGKYDALKKLVADKSDEQLSRLRLGGHDPEKVYAAYHAAVQHRGSPVVILARTVKGYGLGEAGEGKNITHQQKKLNEQELRHFRSRFGIPVSDDDIDTVPFYKPAQGSVEMQYLLKRRKELGGFIPVRRNGAAPLPAPEPSLFDELKKGTGDRPVPTTMAFVRQLSILLKDKTMGPLIVPIVPDEARTFGMESLFRQVGIYSHVGQLYEPVDHENLLYYKEATNGQIFEEGITEAGSMATFIAAGTAYATHGVNTIPFYIFYSMFGLQRIGDLVWAAGDMRTRGFLLGGTSGRTTLAGEGLQHQDGHSHLLAMAYPMIRAYDPAYAYELATILEYGINEMFVRQKDVMYYLTVMNEPYPQPSMPKEESVSTGIINGLYQVSQFHAQDDPHPQVMLWGSGSILPIVQRAAKRLAEQFRIGATVWSATSYKQLADETRAVERWNMLNPANEEKKSHLQRILEVHREPVVAVSDYLRAVPQSVAPWVSQPFTVLGTDGVGRSDGRQHLRQYFEIDEPHIIYSAMWTLYRAGKIEGSRLEKAKQSLHIADDTPPPWQL